MMTETAPKPGLARYLPVAGLAAAAGLAYWQFGDLLSFETLAENRDVLTAWRDDNYLVAALSYIAIYIAAVALSVPGALFLTLAGGFMFGLFPGALFIVAAATIGATIIFLAARTGFGESMAAKLDASEGLVQKLKRGLAENELSFLFLMRLVPAVPFFAANLIPALVGVSTSRFLLTTFFGIMPGTIVYTWVGAGLGEVFAKGETPSLGIIWEPHVLGPILGLCLLAALPIIVKFFRKEEV